MQKSKDMELRTLNKRHAFGIKSDVYGCIHWLDESTLAYPIGRNVVIHNIQSNAQKFFLTSEKTDSITAIALSPNKKYIAIAESGEHPQIQIVDTNTRKRRRVLNVSDLGSDRFVCMQFSADGRHLATQGGAPQWNLLYWNWERSKPLAQVQVTRDQATAAAAVPQAARDNSAVVTQVSINPKDPLHIVVSGNGLFRFYRYVDGLLKASPGGLGKGNMQNFTAHCWVTENRIIVATDNADLLLIEDNEFQCPLAVAPSDNHAIYAIVPTSKGFVCGGEMGLLHIFEHTDDKELYKKARTLTIEPKHKDIADDVAKKCVIRQFALTHGEDMLAMATSTLQVYGLHFGVDWSKHDNPVFMSITQPFHAGPIVGLDTCVRKPLVATSSTDRTVRIWNTQEHTVEVIKAFSSEPGAIALHPSGLHIIVCFAERVVFMNLYGDNIQEFKSWGNRGVSEVRFSIGGQYFAYVHASIIYVYHTYRCDSAPAATLRGHSQRVKSIEWCSTTQFPTDTRLVSCSVDGTVIDWNLRDMRKESDHIDKRFQYQSVVSDDKNIWVVGTPSSSQHDVKWRVKLRELEVSNLHGDAIANDYEFPDLQITTLTLAAQHRLLFGGCSDGSVKLMTFPLQGGIHDPPILGHAGPITKMALSFDEAMLFTVGNDGSFYMFDVKEDGRATKREIHYAEEILISKMDLEEKNNQAGSLRQAVEDLKQNMEYLEKRRGMQHDQAIKELTDQFKERSDKLAAELYSVWTTKVEQERAFAEIKREKAEGHRKSCKELSDEKESQLSRLKDVCDERRGTLERQRHDFALQLQLRDEEIERQRREAEEAFLEKLGTEHEKLVKLQNDYVQEQQTQQETRQQLEMDTDAEIENVKSKHNELLTKELDKYLHMKGEHAIMKKNLTSLQKEMENKDQEMETLELHKVRLTGQIDELQARTKTLHEEIDKRDITIGEREKKIYELKKMNQDLEKHKFVLDHRIRQLKSQIEPRQLEIAKENERIKIKDQELEQYHKNNLALRIQIEELKGKISTQQKTIKTHLNKLKDYETYRSRVKNDIGELAQKVQDPDLLRSGIVKIYSDHVLSRGGQRSASLEGELRLEFNQQTDYLGKTVESLKRKVQQDHDLHKAEVSNVMAENLRLIDEIHEMRKHIRALRNAGTEEGGGATVGGGGAAATAASMAAESTIGSSQQAAKEHQKEIEMNKIDIMKLRSKIEELEKSLAIRQQVRPGSRDKFLPPM